MWHIPQGVHAHLFPLAAATPFTEHAQERDLTDMVSTCRAQHAPERDLPDMVSTCGAQHAPERDLPDMVSTCRAQHAPERDLPDMWYRRVAPSTRQNTTCSIYGIGLCYIKNTNNPNESRALPYNTCITINLRVQALRCRVRWSGSAEPARAVTDDARAAR
jgi:hypothetical protein